MNTTPTPTDGRPPTPVPTPIPVPADAAAVILCGGVFDPPHRAHTGLPALARDAAVPGAWLVFVPASRSPFKSAPLATDADRLAMLKLSLAPLPRSAIWTDELDRARPGEPSYWIETLARARRALGPGVELRFLIGADQALGFHRWREPRRILELAEPLVMLRSPAEHANALADGLRSAHFWSDHEIDRWLDRIVPVPIFEVSGTAIRARLAAGEREIPELDPSVLDYIRRGRLYLD